MRAQWKFRGVLFGLIGLGGMIAALILATHREIIVLVYSPAFLWFGVMFATMCNFFGLVGLGIYEEKVGQYDLQNK